MNEDDIIWMTEEELREFEYKRLQNLTRLNACLTELCLMLLSNLKDE